MNTIEAIDAEAQPSEPVLEGHDHVSEDVETDGHLDRLKLAAIEMGGQLCEALSGRVLADAVPGLREARRPSVMDVLYVHSKFIFALAREVNAHEQNSQSILFAIKALAASVDRWPDASPFGLEEVRSLFERSRAFGIQWEGHETWSKLLDAARGRASATPLM